MGLARLIDSDPRVQPWLCCVVCHEVYVTFDKRQTITPEEVLDVHYASEHE